MNPRRSGLQRPPGFLIEPGGGGQSRLRVPLVPQKKDPRAGGRVCPRGPSVPPYRPPRSLGAEAVPCPGQARPRGASRASGADSCGLPNPRSGAPPARGRLDGPDAAPARPVGVAVPLLAGARSPALAPGPLRRPRPAGSQTHQRSEGAAAPALSRAHLARTAAALAGLGERKKGGVCWGETRSPDGSSWKPPTLSPFSSLRGAVVSDPALGAS